MDHIFLVEERLGSTPKANEPGSTVRLEDRATAIPKNPLLPFQCHRRHADGGHRRSPPRMSCFSRWMRRHSAPTEFHHPEDLTCQES